MAEVATSALAEASAPIPNDIDTYSKLCPCLNAIHPSMILCFVPMGPASQILGLDFNHNTFKTADCAKVLFLLLGGIEKARNPKHRKLGLDVDVNGKHAKLDDEPLQLVALDVKVRLSTILPILQCQLCESLILSPPP